MRFFPVFPSVRNEMLYQSLMNFSVDGPQKKAFIYFQNYFSNGGRAEHPELGSLYSFAEVIDKNWEASKYGLNLVSTLIHNKLRQLKSEESDEIEESDEEERLGSSMF